MIISNTPRCKSFITLSALLPLSVFFTAELGLAQRPHSSDADPSANFNAGSGLLGSSTDQEEIEALFKELEQKLPADTLPATPVPDDTSAASSISRVDPAAQPSSSETPVPASPLQQLLLTSRASPKSPVSILLYKAVMSEMSFRRAPELPQRSEFVLALEKLVTIYCMPSLLRELTYSGDPQKPECLSLLRQTFEIDPTNPVALCARDGMTAASCREAYNKQLIAQEEETPESSPTPLSSPGGSSASKVTERLNSQAQIYRRTKTITELNAKLADAERLIAEGNRLRSTPPVSHAKPSPTLDVQQINAAIETAGRSLAKILAITCDSSRIKLELPDSELKPEGGDPNREASVAATTRKEAGYGEISNSGASANNSDKPGLFSNLDRLPQQPQVAVIKQYKRTRILTQECMSNIKRARNFNPQFALARCFEVGLASPPCIEAIQREKKSQEFLNKNQGIYQEDPSGKKIKKEVGTLSEF